MILSVPKGDYGITYTFHSVKKNATSGVSVKDLTGFTVTLKMWVAGSPGTLLLDAACTVTNAAGGVCTYTSLAGDFDTVGTFNAELELTEAGIVDSSMPFTIHITESG
jgi:hypothetical protein